ncbi:hypothetical protein NRF11_13805 [Bacillus velezensis]|nr:hypothetical protein NRF11_13805 [Bacillus velezensis]
MIKDLIGKLTDAFLKDEKSNIGKLFLIVDEQLTALKNSLTTAEQWRDIDAARGKSLDLLGITLPRTGAGPLMKYTACSFVER